MNRNIVTSGTADRKRAILLTSVSIVAGSLLLVYGIGGAEPYMSPMALNLACGLLFSTSLTLVLVSCLDMAGEDNKKIYNSSVATQSLIK